MTEEGRAEQNGRKRQPGQTAVTPAPGIALPEDEPDELVRKRFWTEFEGAQRFGAQMTVLPARYFADDPAPEPKTLGRGVTYLDVVLASTCAGMRQVPRQADVIEALLIEEPQSEHRILVRVLTRHIPAPMLLGAERAGAFRWRDLAAAARRTGNAWCRNGWEINRRRKHRIGPDVRKRWSAKDWYDAVKTGSEDVSSRRRERG